MLNGPCTRGLYYPRMVVCCITKTVYAIDVLADWFRQWYICLLQPALDSHWKYPRIECLTSDIGRVVDKTYEGLPVAEGGVYVDGRLVSENSTCGARLGGYATK